MKYMGSKRRIAKDILPIILKDRQPDQWYVEPFVGGANLIDKVDGLRLGADNHYYLICFLKAIAAGWLPPTNVSEELYNEMKSNKDKFAPELVGFVGFNCTYMSKWFGGYGRNKQNRNYALEGFNNAKKQAPLLKGIKFVHCSYENLEIPNNSIIYCDPPYDTTTKYRGIKKFDSEKFWQWCKTMSNNGHQIFISEYQAPSDFSCIWQKDHSVIGGNAIGKGSRKSMVVEKLFTL